MCKDLLARFGNNVRTARRSKNLTQEDLAALADLDRTYISDVERGVRNISLKSIQSLALALEFSITDLVKDL